jgi:hypothetical protein
LAALCDWPHVGIPSLFTRLFVVAALAVVIGMVAPSFWTLTIFVPSNFRGFSLIDVEKASVA